MVTTSHNRVAVAKWSIPAPLAVDTDIKQGDRVSLSAGLLIKQTDKNTDWIGVANFQNPDALSNGVTSGDILGTGSLIYMILKSGDTVVFNTVVYCEDDQQTVTTTSTTRKVAGYARVLASTTGDGSALIKVDIRPTLTGAP